MSQVMNYGPDWNFPVLRFFTLVYAMRLPIQIKCFGDVLKQLENVTF